MRDTQNPTGPAEIVHAFRHDSFGRVSFEDSLGAKLRWTHDPLLRVRARREIGALGLEVLTTTTFVMGPSGARVERHDAEGRTTTFLYDGALRLQELREPGYVASPPAHRTLYEYDLASRLDRIVDGNGTAIRQSLDAAGRMTRREVDGTFPLYLSQMAAREDFTYDAIGRLESVATIYGAAMTDSLVEVTTTRDSLQAGVERGVGVPGRAAHPCRHEQEQIGERRDASAAQQGNRMRPDPAQHRAGITPRERRRRRARSVPGGGTAQRTHVPGGGTGAQALDPARALGDVGGLPC